MPRGNDKEAQETQLHELADQFGEGVGNAEELINANAARRTQELAAISSLPVIQADTDQIDLDKLSGPNGEYVVDAVIRGAGRTKGLIAVYEDEGARTHKFLVESNYADRPSSGIRRSSHAAPAEEGDAGAADAESGSGSSRGRRREPAPA